MDADLIQEVNRLRVIYEERGLQLFRYACLDGWQTQSGRRASSTLFVCCTPDGVEGPRPDGKLCGCLTEIKSAHWPTGPRVAWTDEWTQAIQADARIPWIIAELMPESLGAFGEWQQTFRDYFRNQPRIAEYAASSYLAKSHSHTEPPIADSHPNDNAQMP